MSSKMACRSIFTRCRQNARCFLLRSFCEDVPRRIEIENFNKIIVYGRPRLAYNILPATSSVENSEPLVILHGMFGSKTNWQSLSKTLNRRTGRMVLSFDARNHGESEHHISMTYEAMLYDAMNLLEKLSIEKCIVMGHSMGGKTVMGLALQRPDIVSKLIVVDSAPKTSVAATAAVSCLKAMMTLDLREIKTKKEANDALKYGIKDDKVRQFILTNLTQSSNGMNWIINLQFFHKNLKDLLGFPNFGGLRYEGPALFIAGQDSDYITDEEMPDIYKLFPSAEIQYIQNAGHWVHSDQPTKFLDSVCRFLQF